MIRCEKVVSPGRLSFDVVAARLIQGNIYSTRIEGVVVVRMMTGYDVYSREKGPMDE
jgi:hypothetical protein